LRAHPFPNYDVRYVIMHGIARHLRTHKTEVATTLIVMTTVFVAGILLKDYDVPTTIHGIYWITSPIARFLQEGGTPALVAKAIELGLACGFAVAALRHLQRRSQTARKGA